MKQEQRHTPQNSSAHDPLNLFILFGPSGAGKGSILARLQAILPIKRVTTTSSRPMRPGESEGSPYYFVSRAEFERKITAGEMAEYTQHYNGNFYGTTKAEIEAILADKNTVGVWELEWQGVITAKKLYPSIKAIYVTVEDIVLLAQRLRRRQPDASKEFIKERLDYIKQWQDRTDLNDYVVYNRENQLDQAVAEVRDIIENELNPNNTRNQ